MYSILKLKVSCSRLLNNYAHVNFNFLNVIDFNIFSDENI